MFRSLLLSICIFFAIFGLGCSLLMDSESEKEEAVNSEIEQFIHTVNYPGETLELIGRWYTGGLTHTARLRNGNPELPRGLLALGSRVRIPKKILTTNKLLPVEYVKKNSGVSSSPFILNTPLEQTEDSPISESELQLDLPATARTPVSLFTIETQVNEEALATPSQTITIPANIFDELRELNVTQTPEAAVEVEPTPFPLIEFVVPEPGATPAPIPEPTITEGRKKLLEQMRGIGH